MAEFVSGSFDSVVFWDAKAFTKKKTAQPFPDSACHLSSLSWNSTNTRIAVIPKEAESVALCDVQDDTMTWSYVSREESNFTCGCLLQNSRYLAAGSKDTSVHVWDLKSKSIFRTFPGHSSPVKSLARSHNDHWIVSGGEDGAILMHTVDNSTSYHLLKEPSQQPNSAINRLCFSHVEKYQFGSVCEDGVVCIWSVESQRLLHKYSAPHTGPASDLCFSPSNNMLMISVGMDSKIKCYDIQTRKIVTEVSSPSPLTSVTMLRDGSTLLAGSADGKLYVYELRTVKYPKNTLVAHKTAVTCVVQQSYIKSSSRKSSKPSSSSKGKHTPSNHDSASPTPPPIDLPSSPSLTNHHHQHQKQPPKAKVEGSDSATPPLNSKAGNKRSNSLKDPSLSITPTGQSASKRSHSLKDSVNITPFITTSAVPGASGGGSGEGSKGDVGVVGGGVLGNGSESVATPPLFTPASHRIAQTSSIFSPIDPTLITPIATRATTSTTTAPPTASDHTPSSTSSSSSHPITTRSQGQPSSAHPTAASSPIATRSHVQPASSSSIHPTSTSSSAHPASSSPHPSSFSTTHTRPTATPIGSGETSGIFSPLESSRTVSGALLRHQPMASPLLIARTERGVSKRAGVEPRSVGVASGGVDCTDGIQHSVSDEGRIPMSEHAPGNAATGRATSQTQLTQMLEKQTGLDTPTLRSSHTLSSTHSILDSASSSSADLLSSTALSLDPPPPAPPIPASTSSIQMKFIENTIRDAHEETLQTLHQDIRALSVDTIKLFCSLQQQSAAQHAALVEKVDKLSQDLRRVEEMVHQYMPKH